MHSVLIVQASKPFIREPRGQTPHPVTVGSLGKGAWILLAFPARAALDWPSVKGSACGRKGRWPSSKAYMCLYPHRTACNRIFWKQQRAENENLIKILIIFKN